MTPELDRAEGRRVLAVAKAWARANKASESYDSEAHWDAVKAWHDWCDNNASALLSDGWREIATAPRDGRFVLCRGHNGDVIESMRWVPDHDGKDGNWCWYEGDCPRTPPTHWMPQPPPPGASQ